MFQTTINIGYARVSTHKQDLGLEVQMEALKHCDQLFIERESGSNNVRPELEKALKLASDLSQDGKQVIFTIYKLDRLTRSMFKLLELIERFNASDIQLDSLPEKLKPTRSSVGYCASFWDLWQKVNWKICDFEPVKDFVKPRKMVSN